MTSSAVAAPAEAPEPDELRVSTLELFFDLVFVFTLTQLTALIEHDLSLEGALRVTLVFAVLFWMYGGFAWLTNQLPPVDAARRLLIIGAMAAFLVCALAIPHAFDGSGLAFGLGYLLVVLVHGGLYGLGYGRGVWRFVPLNVVGAGSIIAAAFVDGMVQYGLWAAPLVLERVASALTARVDASTLAGYAIRPAHFVERHGLLLIVALGESVVAVGIGLADVELVPGVFGAAVLGLALAAAMWWTYFVDDHERAEAALSAAPASDRLRMALDAYFYAFIPILLGVVSVAAGAHLVIGGIGERLDPAEALLLGGGVALFLAGTIGFRRALGIRPVIQRAAAASVALATIAAGVIGSGLVQVSALLVTLVGMLVLETVQDR